MTRNTTQELVLAERGATVDDVARDAGVSHTTASFVLSGSKHAERISNRTKRRVLSAANRLGYSRNAAAAALQRGYSDTIVLLAVTWEVVEGHTFTIASVTRAATQRGLSTILHLAEDDEEAGVFVRGIRSLNPYGLLLLWDSAVTPSTDIVDLYSGGLPIVDLMPTNPEGIISVTADRVQGFCLCVEHLIGLGHRRIGVILDTTSRWRSNNPKLTGYKRGLEHAGIAFDPSLVQEVLGVDFEAGQEGLRNLLDRRPDVTAVTCMNDPTAIGAVAAARQMGMRVPEDVSIAGYGAHKEGTYITPRLTSVGVPASKIAGNAVDVLINIRSEGTGERKSIYEPMEMVIRESTGPAKDTPGSLITKLSRHSDSKQSL